MLSCAGCPQNEGIPLNRANEEAYSPFNFVHSLHRPKPEKLDFGERDAPDERPARATEEVFASFVGLLGNYHELRPVVGRTGFIAPPLNVLVEVGIITDNDRH